jgi:hypothetical protein
MNKMKHLIAILLFIFISAFSVSAQEDRYPYLDSKEAELYLGGILRLEPHSDDISERLKEYRNITALYVKARDTDPPTKDSIKVFLFTILMADIRNSAETQEAAAEDTLPLMKKNPKLFFQALDDIPFCTESACNALREYFDLYKKPGKDEFIKEFEPIIRELLNYTEENCLNSLKK